MNTIANDKLTRDYLQKLERQNFFATACCVVIITTCIFWSLFHMGGDRGLTLLSNIMYPLTSAIGACWAFTTAYRARRGPLQLKPHTQLAWLLVGLGLLANCFGGIYFTYLQQREIADTVTSASDIAFTLFYPLTFVALLVMPSTLQFRKRFALDALITTLCALGISWYFFIYTIFLANRNAHESLYTFVVTISYPCWDMLLILALVLLIQRQTGPILRMSLALFAAGILCQIWADTGYAYILAINVYKTGVVYIAPFWFIGFLLFGLSALYQYSSLAHRAYNERTHPALIALRTETKIVHQNEKSQRRLKLAQDALIYLPFSVLLTLMLYSEYTEGLQSTERSFLLIILTAIVGILVTFRSLLAARENEILLQEREQGRQEAEHLYQTAWEREAFAKAMASIATRLNSAVVELTEIYQLICTEAANALRADYALLYSMSDSKQLMPLAISISEQEPQASLEDWPPISQKEYEGQALSSLQPILMQLHPPRYTPVDNKALDLAGSYVRQKNSGLSLVKERDSHSISLLGEKLVQHFAYTAILAPLIAGGDPLGLLVLARSIPPGVYDKVSFATSDLLYAQDFAEQAAVALTNAQLYQRLRTAHQRLQELDQLKDQFMITASHELRTPLTAVQGYIELLAQYDAFLQDEQRSEFLRKAQRSCDELVILLHNVMDASRLEIEAGIRSTHSEPVLVEEMIDSVLNLIEPQLTQEQREVHLSLPAQLCVQADRGRLRQVLVNLSANALKYSPPYTPIAFSAHSIFDQKRYVIISVTDKGKGITFQDQTRLFERFVRLESDINSPIRGSGLGLYISRRLVEVMNGKIWVESSGIPGEGSTFYLQLPAAH